MNGPGHDLETMSISQSKEVAHVPTEPNEHDRGDRGGDGDRRIVLPADRAGGTTRLCTGQAPGGGGGAAVDRSVRCGWQDEVADRLSRMGVGGCSADAPGPQR